MQLELTVGLPPPLNNAYTNAHGRRVLLAPGREYKASIRQMLQISKEAKEFAQAAQAPNTRFSLTLRMWFKNRQRTDISNRVKLLEDALSEALGFDDCNVDILLVERAGYDKLAPRAEVVLEIIKEK